MALSFPDATLDLGLDAAIGDVVTRVDLCSTQPTTYAEATSTYTLGNTTVNSGNFTKANGDTSGRKITLGALSGVSVTATGTAAHLALTNGSDTLYAVLTVTSQAVTSGNTFDLGAVDVLEIRDVIAE